MYTFLCKGNTNSRNGISFFIITEAHANYKSDAFPNREKHPIGISLMKLEPRYILEDYQ